MYFDGSLKLSGDRASVLFISPSREQLKYVLQILWLATNNKAEYEALLHSLRLAASLDIKRLLVYGDSSVVVNQINKDWDCAKEIMDAYCAEVRKLEKHFLRLEIHHVVRDLNVAADALAKLGIDRAEVLNGVFVQELAKPSIKPTVEALVIITPAWTQVFIDYIREHKLPADKTKAEHVSRRSRNYVLVGNNLYRKGASSGVLLKCITIEEGKEILKEIHAGCYGNYVASRTLVDKVFGLDFIGQQL